MRRLVCLDLDGTVLHEGNECMPELAAQLRELDTHSDFELVIATGRSVDATLPVVRQIGIAPEWIVCCNGAIVLRRAGEPVPADTSETEAVTEARQTAYEKVRVYTFVADDLLLHAHERIPTAFFGLETNENVFYYTKPIPSKTLPETRQRVEFEELLGKEAVRLTAIAPCCTPDEFFEKLGDLPREKVMYAVDDMAWLDVPPPGVSKATGLAYINEHVGAAPEKVFVAGDGENDLEMLAWGARAGRAVAMGQAPETVKAVANAVTLPADEGGLLIALHEWL
ncbi:MAG: HAD family hydrolase [Microbacteriaceae bacterium]|nr:HAD family hydrolase [Microbacteriaceae bacterium]